MGTFNTKYNERVTRIQNRLNQMQVNIENDKADKLHSLQKHIVTVDGKLTQWNEANSKKFASFKEKVTECLKYIETDKQAQDYEHMVHLREVENLEK